MVGATWNVSPGGTLQATINAAANGDTILLQAGTYTTTEAFFYVRKPLTVVGAGPTATVIQSPPNAGVGIQITASNVTIERLRVTAAQFGVIAQLGGPTLSNVVLRDILVDNATTAHGLLFEGVTNGLIQRCRVAAAYANGIMLDAGSSENVVSNNTVQSTQTQHAIAIKNSDRNTVVNNTITGSGFHGIILVGAQYNRIHLNSISGHAYDGITLTWNGDENGRLSPGNYVGQNTIAGNVVRTDGTGIWMTRGADGTYVFGNVQYGAVEGGISSFNADSNWIRGNVTSSDGHAGVLIWKFDPQAKRNEYTTVHNNLIFNQQPQRNGILFRGAWFNEAAWNHVTNSHAGLTFEDFAGVSGESTLFENTVRNVDIGLLIPASNQTTQVFRNRFMGIDTNYVIQGAGATLDASKWLGGNFWSDHPSIEPYSQVVTQSLPITRSGTYVDRFPFPEETLANEYERTTNRHYRMQVDAPVAGTVAAANSRKTIAWRSRGCVLVDLYLISPAGNAATIGSNYPDHGYFHWVVPAVTPRTDYQVRVDCKNSAGITRLSAFSPPFTVSTGDLTLLAPGPDIVLNGGQTTRVVWARSGAAPTVDVLYRLDSGPWTPIVSNVNGDDVLITVPNVGWSRVQFRVQASNNPSLADGTDRHVVIRDGSVAIFSPGFNANAIIGEALDLEWVSPQGSTFVSIDLWDSQAQIFRPVTQNLADFGRYRWLVPELYLTAGYLRWTFKNAQGATIFVQNGGPLNIRYTTAPGSKVPFYRLYSSIAREHLYTTSQVEYDYLGANGWVQERTVGDILNGPLRVGTVDAIPLYRLFEQKSAQHLWTTDRNEYFTWRAFSNWSPENFVGYLFPTQVPGTIPYLRLVYQAPPYSHHWTSSACEHNYLRTTGSWKSEGIVGYIYPNADTDTNCTQQPVLSSAPSVLISKLQTGSQFSRSLTPVPAAVTTSVPVADSSWATAIPALGSGDVLNTPETPVEAGDVVTIFLSGEDLLHLSEPNGVLTLAIDINEMPAEVLSAEATAEESIELRIRIPEGLPSGPAGVVVRSINAVSGKTLLLFIR